MSRTLLIDLPEGEVVAKCLAEKVGVSAIERLPSGGTRLVCSSSAGAERMRKLWKRKLIAGEVMRERHRPTSPLW